MIQSILILYSYPLIFMPDGSPDRAVQESVLSRLHSVEDALHCLGYSTKALEVTGNLLELVQEIHSGRDDLVFNLCEEFLGCSQLEMNVAAVLELLQVLENSFHQVIIAVVDAEDAVRALMMLQEAEELFSLLFLHLEEEVGLDVIA